MLETNSSDIIRQEERSIIHKRLVHSKDESFLYELYSDIRSAELQMLGWDDAMKHSFLQMQWKAQCQAYTAHYPEMVQQIILIDDLPVGRLLVAQMNSEIRLVDISILSEHRNSGIGTTLLQELQRDATSHHIPLRLSVFTSNPAKRLYTRLGFTIYDNQEIYDLMEWRPSSNR